MPERLSDKVEELLNLSQGRRISLKEIREYLHIETGSKDDTNLRVLMSTTMVNKKLVAPSGYNDGFYKVIKQVKPVQVFGRERRPPVKIIFPKDYYTGMEMFFAEYIVLREGDLILISGVSNYGKTTLCINFCGENIDSNPVLMGNEYTTIDGEPSSRFMDRLDNMDWVKWANEDGTDRFTLLPVREDYAEHIVKDRLNIIDWINLPGEYYMISPLMEGIKRQVGKGNGIITIQKNPGLDYGRGGNPTKDFADVELLIDNLGNGEVLLTIGKVKEYTKPVSGKTFAYGISKGVKIVNFREIVKCPTCYGKGWKKSGNTSIPCDNCRKIGYVDK